MKNVFKLLITIIFLVSSWGLFSQSAFAQETCLNCLNLNVCLERGCTGFESCMCTGCTSICDEYRNAPDCDPQETENAQLDITEFGVSIAEIRVGPELVTAFGTTKIKTVKLKSNQITIDKASNKKVSFAMRNQSPSDTTPALRKRDAYQTIGEENIGIYVSVEGKKDIARDFILGKRVSSEAFSNLSLQKILEDGTEIKLGTSADNTSNLRKQTDFTINPSPDTIVSGRISQIRQYKSKSGSKVIAADGRAKIRMVVGEGGLNLTVNKDGVDQITQVEAGTIILIDLFFDHAPICKDDIDLVNKFFEEGGNFVLPVSTEE